MTTGAAILFEKLKSDAMLEDIPTIHFASNCYPNPHQILLFVYLIVPALLEGSSKIHADIIPELEPHHRWLSNPEISELRPVLKPKLVDKLVSQV